VTGTARERRDPYQPFREQMLSAARVRELSQLRPGRVVIDVAVSWLIILGAWSLAAIYTTWWSVGLAIIVVGTQYYALFIIGHDGLHRRLFPRRETNDLFCDLFVFAAIGAITRLNNRNHLAHHQHLATGDDPDRYKHACFNKSNLGELLAYLSGLATIWTSVRNVFFPAGRAPRGETRDDGYTLRDVALLGGVQLSLMAGLTFVFGWWGWPLLWAVPVYIFTYLGDSIRSFAEHSQPESDVPADEHRLISYVSSPLEAMFFAPKNMNFHAAHHFWVSIPYYNLPIADAEMRRHPLASRLEWRHSYAAYLLRYALALPLEECRAGNRAAEPV
jgi:fatty acid desaturase